MYRCNHMHWCEGQNAPELHPPARRCHFRYRVLSPGRGEWNVCGCDRLKHGTLEGALRFEFGVVLDFSARWHRLMPLRMGNEGMTARLTGNALKHFRVRRELLHEHQQALDRLIRFMTGEAATNQINFFQLPRLQ
jgi:hypothetical protein